MATSTTSAAPRIGPRLVSAASITDRSSTEDGRFNAALQPIITRPRHGGLLATLDAAFDPRRGLDHSAAQIVATLRQATGALVAGLVLPSSQHACAWLSTADHRSIRTHAEMHQQLEALLQGLPEVALSHARRHTFGLLGGTRLHTPHKLLPQLPDQLDQLAALLQARSLIIVPLTRYGHRHGHLLLGMQESAVLRQAVAALADAAPELLRMVEMATLVDRLQEESAAHERARIGRDLHDSAIQPYLGLKYAVESVALSAAPDNPLRSDIDALVELVNHEIALLRELIGDMRSGEPRGDNALVPALQRQAERFAQLFGIAVEVRSPQRLVTSRARAGALFHMVNEALNNVRKHTPARQVWLTLDVSEHMIQLRVRDDAGSVLGRPVPDFRPGSLSDRTAALGGHVALTRPDGLNTELVITIPT